MQRFLTAPVRKAIYGLVIALGPLLVALGIVTEDMWPKILAAVVNLGAVVLALLNVSDPVAANTVEAERGR